jgi:cytochrome c oxidase accessory protein FixG
MSEQPGKRKLFSTAPQEELLYSLAADGTRKHIHPVTTHGRFWRVRRVLAWVLIATYVALPLIILNGKPAMLLDLATRKFYIFGGTFHPTDNLILLALAGGIAGLVFFVTATYGRIWCGYACPQTVYLEFLFRPIESLIEGKPNRRQKRNRGPWTGDKALRKTSKWLLYALVALVMATTFVAYFVGWSGLSQGLFQSPLDHRVALGVTLFVTAMVVLDFGYFRDQMCTVACPYGRLQNVLVDDDTIVVAYDTQRGEPRGKPKKGAPADERGDCVDCKRCLTTCPTGMDIRRGLQLECVGCAQCVEACDEVMERVKRPQGLIRYTSTRELETGKTGFWRARVLVYVALLAVAWGSFFYLSVGRADARIEFLRSGREAYRVLHTGQVANQLRVRITNQRHEPQRFTISLAQPKGAELVVSINPLEVAADQVQTATVAVKLDRSAFERGRVTGRFVVQSDGEQHYEEEFVFLGPYR